MEILYNRKKLYEIMIEFYNITGIRISFLRDFDSPVMGYPSENCALCQRKQQDARFYAKCKKDDERASREATASGELYLYECHYHLWEAIQPVKIEGESVGYFLLGQILADRARFIALNRPTEEEIELLDKMPSPSLETFKSYTKLLSWLAHYSILDQNIRLSHRETFETISAYIREHYREPLSVDALCGRFHYSRSGLFALFKKESGQGVMEYVNGVRLEESKRLLHDCKVMEVASLVGISDPNYFSRSFRKKFGVSPAVYRAKYSE